MNLDLITEKRAVTFAMSHPLLAKLKRPIKRQHLQPSPSLDELKRYLHITDCMLAIDNWKDSWNMCPVCGALHNEYGMMEHKGGEFS